MARNVRELKNAVEYAGTMCETDAIDVSNCPMWIKQISFPPVQDEKCWDEEEKDETIAHLEQQHLRKLLKKYGTSTNAKKI